MLVPPTALTMLIAMAGGPAGSAAVGRCVGISRANLMRASHERMSLRISSDGKSRNERRGPASRPITFSPLCASGSAAVPPAAPSPTMTTSVFLSWVAMSAPPGDAEDGVVGGGPVRGLHARADPLLHGRDGQLDAGEPDEVPADEVGVAAVVGIAEHALERVLEHRLEERVGARGEPRRRAGLELAQDHVLLVGGKLCERRAEPGSRVRVERREPARVDAPERPQLAGERPLDEPQDLRLARARTGRVRRDEALE